MIYHDGYNDLDGLHDFVDDTVYNLRVHYRNDEFDAIIVTGMSGVIVGVPVYLTTGIPLVIARKPNDAAFERNEKIINYGRTPALRFCFLDDLVDTGETLRRVTSTLSEMRPQASIVNVYQYHNHDFSPTEEVWIP